MKIYLYSTHASQEFDLVQMWIKEGFDVTGVFDCYSTQRPRIRGVTTPDAQPGPEKKFKIRNEKGVEEEWTGLVMADRKLATTKEDMAGIDFYVLMETTDRDKRLEHYAKMGLPTALQCFGQESEEMDKKIVPVLNTYENAHLALYSEQLVDRYRGYGVSNSQLHFIPFGVYPELWQGWIGDLQIACCGHNSIQHRGDGAGWEFYRAISAGLPIVLFGRHTERVGGMGEQPYGALKWWYRRSWVYLAMGTKPAPYTMSGIEAMMAGCPIIFWDNGCGIRDEPWAQGLFISGDIEQVRHQIALILDAKIDVKAQSDLSWKTAMTHFNAHNVSKLWSRLFKEAQ